MSISRLPRFAAVALCAMLAVACNNATDDSKNSGTNAMPNGDNSNMPNGDNSNMPNNDACADVANSCASAGVTCAGDVLTNCAEDANGCLVATTRDCAGESLVCDAVGEDCVPAEMCTDDPGCTAEGVSCNGDVLTTCTMGADGCLDATTQDCAAAGGTCDPAAMMCDVACTDDAACAGMGDGDTFCAADGLSFTTCADTNADGCLEAAVTTCMGADTCDDTGATAMCATSMCADSMMTISCANAGTPITGDTAMGSNNVVDNACNNFGDTYDGMEYWLTFEAPTETTEVTIDITYSNAAISELDFFAIEATADCSDTAQTCAGTDFVFDGAGSLSFDALAGQAYHLLLEPYTPTTETTQFELMVNCLVPACGDGIISAGEECDDGNTADGDGCDMNCIEEMLWICSGEPSMCVQEICGDGVITRSEECDDNNMADGDGCSAACAEEMDFVCAGEPSVCTPDVCGDGILSVNEDCDDNNLVDGDGCDMACEVEFGFECDMTGCAPIPSIGTFGPGDTVPDQMGGPITGGDDDYYTITLTDLTLVSGTCAVGTTGDVDVTWTNADGDRPIFAFTSGDEDWTDVTVPAGTYVIEISAFGATDIDTYDCTIQLAPFGGPNLGNFAANEAVPAQMGGPLASGESDQYTITFSTDVTLTGNLTSDATADLVILNPMTGEGITGDRIVGTDDYLIPLLAGTYVIQVQAVGAITSYTLSVVPVAFAATNIGTFAAGDTIADTVGGMVVAGEMADYEITFSTDVSLDLVLDGFTTGDADILFYSATEFAGGGFAVGTEMETLVLTAGRYVIRVIAYEPDGDLDAFNLSLTPNMAP